MKTYSPIFLAKNLKAMKAKQNLTTKIISLKTGISVSCITEIEAGDRTPHLASFCKIAEALGCDPSKLLIEE